MANFNYYEIDGQQLPRVSAICGQLSKGDALTYWAANCTHDYILNNKDRLFNEFDVVMKESKTAFRTISSEACDIGSQVHEVIEIYIKSKMRGEVVDMTVLKQYDERVENGFLAFLDWESKNNVQFVASEMTVSDKSNHYYAGMIDLIVQIGDRFTVIDFKTSKALYDEYNYQVAAYCKATADCQRHGEINYCCNDAYILRFDKETAEFESKYLDEAEINKSFEVFKNLCNIYYLTKKRLPKNKRSV